MRLETMTPTDEPGVGQDVIETLSRLDAAVTFKVWGGDWCKDCRALLPPFAAALEAAGIDGDRIEHYPVDRDKRGEGTDEYGIEYIPTIVVEVDGKEVARFVESEVVPPAEYLAERLAD